MHFNLHLSFACELFNKHKQRIQISKQTVGSRYIHRKNIDKAIFQHDIAYNAYKNLARRTVSDKVLCYNAIEIDSNPKNEELFEYL